MGDIQSTEDVKQVFDKINLPLIDVRDVVMHKVIKSGERKLSTFRGKKLIVAIVLVIFLLSTGVFAAEKVWKLIGPKNTEYTFELVTGGPTTTTDLFRHEIERLELGKALVIMKVKDNPTIRDLDIHFKPLVVKSLDEFSKRVGNKFKSPAYLPEGYSFKEAQITFKNDYSFMEEMKKECKNTDKQYITQIIELTNNVLSYNLIYSYKDTEHKDISIYIHPDWYQKDITERKYEQKPIKVKVNDFEAIFTEQQGIGDIRWVETQNNNTAYYRITSQTASVNFSTEAKDELIKVAGSLK